MTRCPQLKPYSQAEQRRIYEELSRLPSGSSTSKAITDYSKLRDACRSLK